VETGVAQEGQKRPPTGTSLLHFTQCCTAIRFSVAEWGRSERRIPVELNP
jgi:hypothetical protein